MRNAVSMAPTAVLAAMIRAMSSTVAMLPARSRPGSPSGVAGVPSKVTWAARPPSYVG